MQGPILARFAPRVEIRGGLLQNREMGKSRTWLGRALGRVLRKIRGAGGSAGEGAARGGLSLERTEEQHPRQHSLQHPEFYAALFPEPSPAIFWISPFPYSVAGRPDLNPRVGSIGLRPYQHPGPTLYEWGKILTKGIPECSDVKFP